MNRRGAERCLCGRGRDDHHDEVAECEHYGSNEQGGADRAGAPHCGSFCARDDPDPDRRARWEYRGVDSKTTIKKPTTAKPVLRRGRPAPSDPNRLVVGVADASLERFSRRIAALVRSARVEVVPTSALARPEKDADFVLEGFAPSAPGLEYRFQSMSLSIYEQDRSGVVYRNGARLHRGHLVAFGQPDTAIEGHLAVGQRAALLFDYRFEMFMSLSTPILFLVRKLGG